MFIKNKKDRGITLIALVVTIIVLLILAGISIQMLVGEGGILTNAREAKDRTGEAQAREELDMYLMEYSGNKNLGDTTDLKAFLESKGYIVKDTGDGKLEVEKDGYKFIVDPETLSATLKEMGTPEVSVQVEEPDADKKVTITVEVTNKDELDSIDDVTLTRPDGTKVDGTVDKKTGTATFKVDKNGNYELEVKATTEGKEKTTKGTVKVDKITAEIPEGTLLEYGTIDVIWVDNNNTIDKLETPDSHLSGMKKVAWTWDDTSKTWTEKEEEPSTTTDWYSYRTLGEESKEDNKGENGSHWANAKNEDGSYFVWVPRYAYRVTYYKDQSAYEKGEEPLAYYDGNGLTDKNGEKIGKLNGVTIENEMDENIQTVIKNGKSYIVHPAFYGPGSEDLGGGFGTGKGIAGIWVAKYEISQSESKLLSKPGVKSWRSIDIGECYTNSLNYDTNKNSHLLKNSEWGAVAYLAHSQYGRNGHEITINNNNNNYTGMAGDSVSARPSSETNSYNTEAGGLASTTGNVYGIYDISGGSWEYVAAFNAEGGDNLTKYGSSMLNDTKTSTKYVTAYHNTNSSSICGTADQYKIGKVGDATKEVTKGNDSYGGHWFNDYSYLPGTIYPFFRRGGLYFDDIRAGIFCSINYYSDSVGSGSFRVVLVEE